MGRLFWKIFFGFWLTMVLIAVGVGFGVHHHNKKLLTQMTDIGTGPGAELLVSSAAASLRYGGEQALGRLLKEWPRRAAHRVLVVDDIGRDLFGRPVSRLSLAAALKTAERRARGVRRVVTPDGRRYLLFIPSNRDASAHHRRHGQPRFTSLLPLWVIVAFVASIVFSFALAWYLVRPVRHLRDASRRLAAGDLKARVMSRIGRRRDEIADLGKDFDNMAEQLQALINAQQRLLHDVSHELRSPLARMQVAIGLARQQPDKLVDTLDRVERESERLDELVGQVLTLSRLEAGVNEANEELVDVAALLGDIVADAHFEAEASGRKVSLSTTAATVRGHAELLHRALENVIRNAIKYTAEGTTVEVSMTMDKAARRVKIQVCDRGPGVFEAELDTLFQPFVRLRHTEGSVGGYGLGLTIAKRAINAHCGTISARNNEKGGLCIDILLKVASNPVS